MKKILLIVLFLSVPLIATQAQLSQGDNLLGGTTGFWAYNETPTLGINFENQVSQAGIGSFGLGALARFSNYEQNNYVSKTSNMFIGGQGNYNFNRIGSGKFVPFIGLVLGLYSSTPGNSSSKENGLWLSAQGGFRYFFIPSVAGAARFGLGSHNFNTLELGVDFKF